ncbi:MAG: DUF3892 domain-containing protein [Bacilli bacterium]|nr:DUF3892 domain-containing protein [Bacilli bacterium]
MKRLSVKSESSTGFNKVLHDNRLGFNMTINQAVKKVENGLYPNYHVRTQQDTGKKFIASNPDRSKRNNLG